MEGVRTIEGRRKSTKLIDAIHAKTTSLGISSCKQLRAALPAA